MGGRCWLLFVRLASNVVAVKFVATDNLGSCMRQSSEAELPSSREYRATCGPFSAYLSVLLEGDSRLRVPDKVWPTAVLFLFTVRVCVCVLFTFV